MSDNTPQEQRDIMGYGNIVFEGRHAEAFSIPEAIFLWYIQMNLEYGGDEYDEEVYDFVKYEDGRWWCHVPMQELRERFSFWADQTIRRTRKALEDRGVLLRHDVPDANTWGGVRVWYSIDYDTLRKVLNSAQANSAE